MREKRQSTVLQPMACGIGFLGEDFDDDSSDYDYGDHREPLPQDMSFHSTSLLSSHPGAMNSRAYVGGFSSAAYEAAKAHHYAAVQRKKAKATAKAKSKCQVISNNPAERSRRPPTRKLSAREFAQMHG